VWLCAGNQIVFHDGASFTTSDVTATTGLDGISAIWASSRQDVWAVGDDAIVAHSVDGRAWTRTLVGSPFKSSIWGSGPGDIYALSTFDLSHYADRTWTEVRLDSGAGDGQIFGTSASDVWVVTGSEHPAHFDGQSWKELDVDMIGDMSVVWGASPGEVWAAGSAGSISRWDGSSWDELAHQEIGAPYLRQWIAMHGSSPDDIWLIGRQLGEGGSKALVYHR
jgi:hypothetical protein